MFIYHVRERIGKWIWLATVMVWSSVLSVSAQPKNFQFRQLNVNDGLSHNQVTCFLKDRRGFLWIGTASGLNRFDGYSLDIYRNDSQDSTSLPDNSILNLFEAPDGSMGVITADGLSLYDPEIEKFTIDTDAFYERFRIPDGGLRNIVRDREGRYWFLHNSAGMLCYTPSKNKFLPIRHSSDSGSIFSDSVTSFAQDHHGDYWIIHANGVLETLRKEDSSYRVSYRNKFLFNRNNGSILDYRILADRDGDIWVFTMNDNQGLYYFNVSENDVRHFHKNSTGSSLNNDLVRGIVQGDDGLLWISTDHGGINLLDKKDFSLTYMLARDEDEKSLAQNSINALYRDSDGIIWIGTFKKGVSYYHQNIFRFSIYRYSPLNPDGLPYGDVNRFVEDKDGNLWIGTNGGGLIYFDRKEKLFRQFRHDPEDPNSLGSDVIVSLCIDFQGKLWIGTYYGGLNAYDGKKFIRYPEDTGTTRGFTDQNVWEIFEDSQQRLWVGTLNGGLYLLNRNDGTFSNYRMGDPNSVRSNYIAALTEDREGNIWVGTDQGIDILNSARGRFFHFENEKKNSSSLSDNGVLDIREDSKGRIWIGTQGGLNLFDKENNTFHAFKESDGLPHNTILTVLEDSTNHLWVSTPNGISHIEVIDQGNGVTIRCKNYDEADGLQGKPFNENAALRTSQGELIFGGANGFNIFKPATLPENNNLPPVRFSGLQLYNRSIKIGEKINGRVILSKAISELREITLLPGQNVFSIEFVALNFFHPHKTEYQYQLEGFNTTWLTADANFRKVTFTNLDPGEYVFRLRAVNSDGHDLNHNGINLRMVILPPFWKTNTAFVLYVLLIIAALLVTRKLIQKRERIKFALEQERQQALRMHELDLMKIRFFTNVSHEFRTPLTLILTPLEKILRQNRDESQRRQFELIHRNAKRLLNLVNQLLDFRRLEIQEIKFNPSEGDIIQFIEETVYSFSELSEKKNIKLEFHCAVKSLETIFDQDKLEKILFNLLSNAFKFTPEHGLVSVTVHLQEKENGNWVSIQVNDTGIGIPADKREKIFERFFQHSLPKSVVNQGSGIGLSISREFAKICGGTIEVESTPGMGSSFTVWLPLTNIFTDAENNWTGRTEIATQIPNHDPAISKKPVLLLIDDNEDFSFYLKDNLKANYNIIEARNGVEGWHKALSFHPDLIVSDIMMPEMNGIELCGRIKNDQRVSHIPVILLTARTAEEQQLEGFETGADDYITKPFNFEILMARIRNLIGQRQKLHKAFPQRLDVKASEMQITSLDEKFIQNAVRLVEENVSNPAFSVEQLSHQLGISRAHFYKKVVALTGKSPLEFIRTIRLQIAAQMLQKSQLTVAEVAYKVGFNNPKYFSRYFKEQYKVLPSMYALQMQKHTPSL